MSCLQGTGGETTVYAGERLEKCTRFWPRLVFVVDVKFTHILAGATFVEGHVPSRNNGSASNPRVFILGSCTLFGDSIPQELVTTRYAMVIAVMLIP